MYVRVFGLVTVLPILIRYSGCCFLSSDSEFEGSLVIGGGKLPRRTGLSDINSYLREGEKNPPRRSNCFQKSRFDFV